MSDYLRRLEADLNAEFPAETARLEISTLRFLLSHRTAERDRAIGARDALDWRLTYWQEWARVLRIQRDRARDMAIHFESELAERDAASAEDGSR